MRRSLTIIDDFYADPWDVRRYALTLDYPRPAEPANWPGRNSAVGFLGPDSDRVLSYLVGEPVTRQQGSAHGRCRLGLAGERGRTDIHMDEGARWAGVLYLNTPEQCRGRPGTHFFRHIPTDSDGAPANNGDSNDPAKWERVMTVPMRFNRLVLYPGDLWHANGELFGDSPETGRLIQLFFLVSARPA
jgi:hypothetical protein